MHAQGRPLRVDGEYPPPGLGSTVWLQSDKRTLKKVLLNLTSHGIKDNRPGGSLTISLRLQDGAAALGTRDQDRDMNAERAAQLFQPFNRLDAENRPTKGSGLGLVIARMSTQAMQGRLEVDCQPGAGSTFRLCLPLAAHAADTLRAPLPVLAGKAGSAS